MSAMERLGSMDITWLQIERDTNRMHVTGLLVFETPLLRSRLEDILRQRLLRLERFGQHVLRDSTGAVWETERVDLAAHVISVPLPAGLDEKSALEALVGELAGSALEPSRPLWQLHLVEHYRGGSALIARVHHCLADSIALIGVIQSLCSDQPTQDEPASNKDTASFFTQLYAPLTEAMIDGLKLSGAVWAKYWSLLLYPQQLFDYARTNAALTLEVGKLMSLPDDTLTPLKGKPQGLKHASWSDPLATAGVQAAALAHAARPDAVMLSCLAGALGKFLAQHGSATSGNEVRVLMPVNLRDADAPEQLGNRGGLLPLELPVGIEDPLARLTEVERRMAIFEDAYQAEHTLGLFNLIGQTTRAAQSQALELIASKASAMLCHIPASPTARYLDGAKIIEEIFWSPASGDLGLSLSIISYNGHYQLGLIADAAMVMDPSEITGRIAAELAALAPDAAPPAPRKPQTRKAG